jgi:hypothetical protein
VRKHGTNDDVVVMTGERSLLMVSPKKEEQLRVCWRGSGLCHHFLSVKFRGFNGRGETRGMGFLKASFYFKHLRGIDVKSMS